MRSRKEHQIGPNITQGPMGMNITSAESVDILILADGRAIWLSVDGVYRLHIGRINKLTITDKRSKELIDKDSIESRAVGNLRKAGGKAIS